MYRIDWYIWRGEGGPYPVLSGNQLIIAKVQLWPALKPVKGIPRWFLLKLKLFKFKMKQSKIKSVEFFLWFRFCGKTHDCFTCHFDSSKSERCAVKFPKMFLARYKRKNLMLQIKLLWNFWIGNESLQGLGEKQVVNNDHNRLILTHPCYWL